MDHSDLKQIFQGIKSTPPKFCDPGICDCCQYIGEGAFLCDKHMEIVVSDWEPTGSYLMCQSRGKASFREVC